MLLDGHRGRLARGPDDDDPGRAVVDVGIDQACKRRQVESPFTHWRVAIATRLPVSMGTVARKNRAFYPDRGSGRCFPRQPGAPSDFDGVAVRPWPVLRCSRDPDRVTQSLRRAAT